jgi:hypothetical protein
MVEIVPATLALRRSADASSEQWKAYPLSPTGQRRQPVPVTRESDRLIIHVRPADKTVWYEVRRQ